MRQPGILDRARCGTSFLDGDLFPGIRQSSARGMYSSEFRSATAGRDGSKKLGQPSEVKISVHPKLLRGGVQHAQTIELGTARAGVVQLPVDVGFYGFLGHKIEQSDSRPAIEVHLRDRESEDPRDRTSERAGADGADLYAAAETRVGVACWTGQAPARQT